jgi:hypothetical protein
MFAKGRALRSRVCGPNLGDATKLFKDMERNESGGSISDILFLLVGPPKCSAISRGRIYSEAAMVVIPNDGEMSSNIL